MDRIASIDTLILLGALLLLAGILSSLIATRFGAPLLLVFLVVGMLAGEEGPGGIQFEDVGLTFLIGSLALAIILFDGGMRTRAASFRVALRPALVLATLGVVLTATITAVFAWLAFTLSPLEALLLGAVVASTDAAAVLFLLRTGGLRLKERVGMTLEIESGINDPVAVFLTVLLAGVIEAGGTISGWEVLTLLLRQVLVGATCGAAGGLAISWFVNRATLPAGLRPILVSTAAVLVFALAAVGGGSGFLAAYLAGLVVGNRPLRAFAAIADFQDAATWFAQIVMFLVLGLLVTPSRMTALLAPSLVVALGLMLVARPVAVTLCLLPFRFSWREIAFVSWVGLRGAVGIFLASIPLLTGMANGALYFNVAFVVVLVSLLVQGWSVGAVARRLGVALPRLRHPVSRVELDLPGQLDYEMAGYRIPADSPILHHATVPAWARLALVVRDERLLMPTQSGELRPGDVAYFTVPAWRVQLLDHLFAPPDEIDEADLGYFGDFTFGGETPLGALGDLYGLAIAPEARELSLAQYFARMINEHPVVGDRLELDGSALIVSAVVGDRVAKVGLQLEAPHPEHPYLRRINGLLKHWRIAR
jgi:cell volume regulation protein A